MLAMADGAVAGPGGCEADVYTAPLSAISTSAEAQPGILDKDYTVAEVVPVESTNPHIRGLNVFVHGKRGDPAIITLHEIGVNHRACFSNFLSHPDAASLVRKCCFYHVDLPGQGEGDENMFDEHAYPTMDQLAEWVGVVAKHFKLKEFFAIGVGVGAYVLTKYIMQKSVEDPAVRGMMVISPVVNKATWREWAYEKLARVQIAASPAGQMPQYVVSSILSGYFGPKTMSQHLDLVQQFNMYLSTGLNPSNYAAFLKAWTSREDLMPALKVKPINVPTITYYGGNSLRNEEILDAAGSDGVFKSQRSSLIEVWRTADMVHQEAAHEVAESFRCFLQGFSIMV